MLRSKGTADNFPVQLRFALLLHDAFTGQPSLQGTLAFQLDGASVAPYQKPLESTFLFFNAFAGGAHALTVRSIPDTPYYQDAGIPLAFPLPHPDNPAFPDVLAADADKLLNDPNQNAAFRAQWLAASMRPSVSYPFPPGATLVRGKVQTNANPAKPLAGVTVLRVAYAPFYVTGDDGLFVLYLENIPPAGSQVTLRASRPGQPDVDVNVQVKRGESVSQTISLAP